MMKKIFFFFSLFLVSCNATMVAGTTKAKVYYHYKTVDPYLCLTFDDGPDKIQTPKVLSILKKYAVKATFFMLGEEVEYQKEMLKLVYNAGHQIGNHFYKHININKASKDEIRESIVSNNELIRSVIGVAPTVVRPPYGIVNENLKEVCGELGMSIIIWTDDKDSRDWAKTPESKIISNVTKKVSNGDIFLFHDGDKSYTNTLSAIDVIIPSLQKKGFQFVTIQTLLNN